MSADPSRTTRWMLKVAGEFAIIVLGVLTALAANEWAQSRADRKLEDMYLQRMLDDVRYDLAELERVQAIHESANEAARELVAGLEQGTIFDEDPTIVAPRLLVAGLQRAPDLSRGTWEEIIASGRIALIRDQAVLRALASYDRAIREVRDAWSASMEGRLNRSLSRTFGPSVTGKFMATCPRATETFEPCPLELTPIEAERTRAVVHDEQLLGDLHEAMGYRGLVNSVIRSYLLEPANELEAAITDALAR